MRPTGERLLQRSQFYGGVHPPAFKTASADSSIRRAFIPKRVIIPLSQHVGAPAEPIVNVGDAVDLGAIIGKAAGFISSPVHASIAGKVAKISYSPTPTQARALSVLIEAQDADLTKPTSEVGLGRNDIEAMSKDALLDIIRDSGIVGLGGAAFPTHVKLSPPKGKPIDSVILNGAECEPYLTCDERLMVENANQIIKGLEIIAKILDVKNTYIAIEDNKPAAIRVLNEALRPTSPGQECPGYPILDSRGFLTPAKIAVLHTKYPQGAEKQIIKAVLNRIVPAGGLPMDVGCVVQNIQTAFAIYEAVYLGRPLIERVITITGDCVKGPLNIRVRVGTLLSDLVGSLGGFIKPPKKIVVGGPMMGIAQYTMEVPITKGTSGVIFLSKDQTEESEEAVCIRCGRCIQVCPMGLAPTTLMYNVKKGLYKEAEGLGVMHCYECGACAYECPAKIPLLDYMKFGKAKVKG